MNASEMFSPKNSAGTTASLQVRREGSGRPVRAPASGSTIHHRIDEPTSRHHAITEPGMPGHLMIDRLSANSSTAESTAPMPTSR